MSDFLYVTLAIGFIVGAASLGLMIHFVGVLPGDAAEFVCKSHDLDLIDFEIKNPSFSKVECGNKKFEYEEYKVFTK